MEQKPRYIIGIDPDIEKSGYAVVDRLTRTVDIVKAVSFVELMQDLNYMKIHGYRSTKEIADDKMFVLNVNYGPKTFCLVIEDSDNTTNWHIEGNRMSVRVASAIGHKVGLCHAVGRLIREWAENLGMQVIMQCPLKKEWMGRDGKITQDEIMQFIPGLPKKMNQECRDAALLAWCYANLPIRIPPEFYVAKKQMELQDKMIKDLVYKPSIRPVMDGKIHYSKGLISQMNEFYEKNWKDCPNRVSAAKFKEMAQQESLHKKDAKRNSKKES